MLHQITRWLTVGFAFVAVASSVLLLVKDTFPSVLPLGHSASSALPLLLIGVAYVCLQPIVQPSTGELAKRLLLALAFILWGIVQLLPPNGLAAFLGDLVIILFVVDLFLILRSQLPGSS